jgi:outer membrane murein-binding lipoprotein Lpp
MAHDGLEPCDKYCLYEDVEEYVKAVRILFRAFFSAYLSEARAKVALELAQRLTLTDFYRKHEHNLHRLNNKACAEYEAAVKALPVGWGNQKKDKAAELEAKVAELAAKVGAAEEKAASEEPKVIEEPIPAGAALNPTKPLKLVENDTLEEIFSLNKRLLHELKELNSKVQRLEESLKAQGDQLYAFYAGVTANRRTVEPAPQLSDSQAREMIAESTQGAIPNAQGAIPNAQGAIPNAPPPEPAGGLAGPGKLGLVKAKAAPGTRPQNAVQRHVVQEPKEGMDIKDPSALADAMAFSDMMKGK